MEFLINFSKKLFYFLRSVVFSATHLQSLIRMTFFLFLKSYLCTNSILQLTFYTIIYDGENFTFPSSMKYCFVVAAV